MKDKYIPCARESDPKSKGLPRQLERLQEELRAAGKEEAGTPLMHLGPVWANGFKSKIRDKAAEAIELKAGLAFEAVSRAVRCKGWSTKNPDQQPAEEDWLEFKELTHNVPIWFPCGVTDYVQEHGYQIKRGNPGRPISKVTAKALAIEMRIRGCTLKDIRKTLESKRYSISLMGIWKWLKGAGLV